MSTVAAYRFNDLCQEIAEVVKNLSVNSEKAFEIVTQSMTSFEKWSFWQTAKKVEAYSCMDVCEYGRRLGDKQCSWLVMPDRR